MQRTFEDIYQHATQEERRVGLSFWLGVIWDEGRSIVRERAAQPQGDLLFYGLVLIWGCAVLIAPVIPALSDWRNLVVPTVFLAVMLLVVPGRSGIARRLATVVVVVAVVEWMVAVAQSMREPNDLLAPVLLVACMALSLKAVAGLNARIVGTNNSIWDRGELTYGLLAGLAGVVGLALGMLDTNDNNPAFAVFFYVVVPFVCGVAGFRVGRRNLSVRAGIYAALGSMLIGATIWFLALPLVYEGAVLTLYSHHAAPALLPLYWQRPLSSTLFWAAVNGMMGAFFGVESLRTDGTAPLSPSPR